MYPRTYLVCRIPCGKVTYLGSYQCIHFMWYSALIIRERPPVRRLGNSWWPVAARFVVRCNANFSTGLTCTCPYLPDQILIASASGRWGALIMSFSVLVLIPQARLGVRHSYELVVFKTAKCSQSWLMKQVIIIDHRYGMWEVRGAKMSSCTSP